MNNENTNAEIACEEIKRICESGLYRCVSAILNNFAHTRFPSIYFWVERKTAIGTATGTPKYSNFAPEGEDFCKLDRNELISNAGDDSGKDFAFEVTKFLSENL
jgi:hypothetical protein